MNLKCYWIFGLYFKVDISQDFRHICIDMGHIDLLDLKHRGKLFLDLSVAIGFRLCAVFFSKIMDAVRFIITKYGHNALFYYIDDLIYCSLSLTISNAYQFLLDLGPDISHKKLCPPDTNVYPDCQGIFFDTVSRT